MTMYAIIGAGRAGYALATVFDRAHVPVTVAGRRGAEEVRTIVSHLGACVTPGNLTDAFRADILFFAVPFLAFKDIALMHQAWHGKVVVDMTNAVGLSEEELRRELNGKLSSEVNATHVPDAKLVKAFNTLPAEKLIAPVRIAGYRRVIFVSSDDAEASRIVAELTWALGLSPFEVGPLREGGRHLHTTKTPGARKLGIQNDWRSVGERDSP